MWNFIKNLDQFGVAYQPKIHYTTAEYKTVQGGIMSVLLYGLSFSYLLYLFIQWQQGSILPKITTLQNVEQNYKLEFLDKYVEMELRKYIYTDIDPFNPDAIILQPVVYFFINGQAPKTAYPYNISKNFNSFGFNRLELKNLTTQISDEQTDENPLIEMMLVLGQCQTYYLSDGQKCADNETITKFFDQKTNTLIVKLQKQEFNTNSEELESINKEMIVPLQKASSFYAQINVKIQNAQVDTGFLFESFDDYDFITDYQITGSMMDKEYFFKILQYEAYAVLYYKIDQIQLLSQIVFPKISEVLADAGSIASTLLLLSYLMIMLNSSYQEFETVNHIIGMYYPEFKNVKIIKNVFGKIIRVENQGKQVNLETFLPYFEKLRKIGQVKLTISNQIYELSRIQFILQYLHSRKFLLQFHKAGIPLQIFQYEQINSKDENQSKIDNSFIQQDQQYKSNQILPNVESQDFKFRKSLTQQRKELAIEITKQDQNTDKTHNSQINEVEMLEQYYREGDFDLLSYPQEDDENDKILKQKEQNNNLIKEQQLKQDATNIDLLQQVQNE